MVKREAFEEARATLRSWLLETARLEKIPRLDEALTHPSYANETGAKDNQRLEFLGDAVLGLLVSEELARAHPEADEGELTRMRSALVNAEALARWAREVSLGDCLSMGRGARSAAEREQVNVLADATEAVVAAVYEAGGLESARALAVAITGGAPLTPESLAARDPKSALQEQVQAAGYEAPRYRVTATLGPPHDPTFEVEVVVSERVVGRGSGRSKRVAERAAATDALRALEESPLLPTSGEGDPA